MPRECTKIKYSTKKEGEAEAGKLLEKYKPKAGEEIHFDSYKCAICTDTWHVTSIYVAMTKRSKENAEKMKTRVKDLERQLAKEQQKPKDGPKVAELTAQVKTLQKQLNVAHGVLSQALDRAFPKEPPKREKQKPQQQKRGTTRPKSQDEPIGKQVKAETAVPALTRTGFRAVSAAELMHIEESGHRSFPPSNGSVHFNFDQSKAEAVANKIAATTGSAFMVKFEVNVEVLKLLKNSPGDIDKINENIVGKIELTGKQYSKKVIEAVTKEIGESK